MTLSNCCPARRFLSVLMVITSTLFLPACSVLDIFGSSDSKESEIQSEKGNNVASSENGTARVEIVSSADLAPNATLSDVEILWQIPKESVEGFVVKYGFDRGAMTHNARIYSKDLEEFKDPLHGSVYRFVLGNVPLDKPLFVSIAAFNDNKISRPSDVFEVKAGVP